MLIKNLSLNNKFIKYDNISLDFSKPGIHKITGPNGSGKTSIIEKIVFGDYDVEFINNNDYNTWKKDRFNLFTYIPQKIYDYSLTVGEYICKGNKQISLSKCEKMLNDFELDISILKTKFNVLSGGEKKKIQIISGLLKDTPYIFIDEPSNNLDNASIENLNKVLETVAKNHIIILVSHDERIKINITQDICIDGNNIKSTSYKNSIENNEMINKTKWKKDFLLTIIDTIKNIPFMLTIFLFVIIITSLICYSYNYFEDNFYVQNYFDKSAILVRIRDQYNSDLNDYYINEQKIKITDDIKNKHINWLDICDDVANIKGINDIYIFNAKYGHNISLNMYYNTLINEKLFISCPKEFYGVLFDFVQTYNIEFVDGTIPKDYQKEVSLSKNVLIKYYGFDETNVDNALGQQIYIEEYNDYYTIVGFTYCDYINISYEKEHNDLIYHYDENTYEDFVLEQYNYLVEVDSRYDCPDEIVLIVDEKENENITDYIFANYPACEIISSSFDEISVRHANRKMFIFHLFINIGISFVFSFALLLMNRSSIKYNLAILEDFGIYYINKKKIISLYKIIVVVMMILLSTFLLVVNSIIDKYYSYTNIYIIIDSLILLVPVILFLILYKGKK